MSKNLNDPAGFFGNKNLTQIEADSENLKAVELYQRPDESFPSIQTARSAKSIAVNFLKSYDDWNRSKGNKERLPTYTEAARRVKAEKFNKNLKSLSGIFSSDDSKFRDAMQKRGVLENYESTLENFNFSEEELKNSYRKRFFLNDLVGDTSGLSEAKVSSHLFGEVPKTTKDFVDKANLYIGDSILKNERMSTAHSRGVAAFIAGEINPYESEDKGINPYEAEAFSNGFNLYKSGQYAKMFSVANKMVAYAKREGEETLTDKLAEFFGFNPASPEQPVSEGTIARFYQIEGGRDAFLYALNALAEKEGAEIDSNTFSKLGKNVLRFYEGVVGNLGRGMLDRAIEEKDRALFYPNDPESKNYEIKQVETVDAAGLPYVETRRVAKKLSDDEKIFWKNVSQVATDFRDLKSAVAQINGDNWFETMIIDQGGTIAQLPMIATMGGALTLYQAQRQSDKEDLLRDYPTLTEDEAQTLANTSAGLNIFAEKAQTAFFLKPLKKVNRLSETFKKLDNHLDRIKNLTKAANPLSVAQNMKAFGAAAGAQLTVEYLQETFQEASIPLTVDLYNFLNKELPEGNWDDFKTWDQRRFLATLPLSLLGAGGKVVRDGLTRADLRRVLKDEQMVKEFGRSAEQAKELAEIADTDPDKALKQFKEQEEAMPKEEREALGEEAFRERISEEYGEEFEGIPIMRQTEDGKVELRHQDGSIEVYESAEEGQAALDKWMMGSFLDTGDAVRAFSGFLQERVGVAEKLDIDVTQENKTITLQDLLDRGQETEANLKKAVGIYYMQKGEQPPADPDINLANFEAPGFVTLKKQMAGFSINLSRGANPLVVGEEFAEGFYRSMVRFGETSRDEMKQLLDEFGELAGIDMTQGFDTDPDRAIVEGFSKFVKAYALQGRHDGLPKETQRWMERAWGILQNPNSVSQKLRSLAELFAKMWAEVFNVAKAIEKFRAAAPAPSVSPEGEVAKEDAAIESFYQLEKYAQRALGLDEATYEAGMRQKMQEEAMSEAFDPKDELSARVSRMLPNPRFYEGKWQGELQAIHDSMVKTDKNGKINKKKADNFFQTKANTGDDQDILILIEELNQEHGFDFQDEDEFFDALQKSVDYVTSDGTMGAQQFPIGATHWTREREEWINGGMSFSIGETVVQPNGNTRILPTENGGLIGPAQIDLSYMMSHRPTGGVALTSLEEMFPDDIYGPNAIRYYGAGQQGEDEAVDVFQRVRNKPNEPVTLYRVVPDTVNEINPGDWVTISKAAAEEMATPEFLMADAEGNQQTPKILEKVVPAKEVFWPGDSLVEQGWFPNGDLTFSIVAYHGTRATIDRFSTEALGSGVGSQLYGYGLYFSSKQLIANQYRGVTTGKRQQFFYKGEDAANLGLSQLDLESLYYDGDVDKLIEENQRKLKRNEKEVAKIKEDIARLEKSDDEYAFEAAQDLRNELITPQKNIDDLKSRLSFLEKNPDIQKDLTRGDVVGNIYRVNLDFDEETEVLDWNNYIGYQSKSVQDKLESLLSRYEWGANILRLLKEDPTNYDGGSLYRELSNKLRIEGADPDVNAYGKRVAKELSDIGIKGVKYRGEQGTTNYVAFNDADIEITAGIGEAFEEIQGEQTQVAVDGLIEVVKSNEATIPGSLAPDSNVDGAVDLTDKVDGLAFDSLTFGISPKLVLNAYPQMDEFLAEQMMSETSTIGAIHIDRAGIGEIDGIPIQGGMLYPAIKENFKKGIGWAFNSISVANDVLSRARANNGYIKLILMTEGNVVGNKTFALIWSNRLKKVLNTKEKLDAFLEEFHKVREAAIKSKVTDQRRKEKKAAAEAKKNGETPETPLAEKDIAAYDRKGANIKTFNQFQKFLLGMSQTARASYYLKRGTQSTDTANRKKGQTIYGKLLGEKIVKKHGWPDPVELVTAMEDPAFKGMKKGDVVGFIKIDPDSTIMTAEEAGVPEHLSYGYVVKGKPYARAKNIRNIEDDYPSIAGQLMAQGAKDYPVSDYATFSIKEVTKQDEEYLQALKDKDFAKAEAMVLQEAKKKGGFKVYHGSWEHRKIAQADRFKPGGYASSRVVYFTDEENRQLSKDFGIVREYFYFPTNRIADIRSKSDTPELRKLIKQFNERGGYGVLDGSHRKKRYGKDFVKGYDPTWELLDDEDYVNAADFLFDGTYDAIQVDEDFAESNELGYDRDAIAIIDTSKIKSADLVTFDQKGKVIPLSQRFNMGVNNLTFSIVEKSQQQNILRAVDRLFGNSQNALEVGLKMKDRLDQVRQRYENLKYRKDFKGEKATREDQIFNALMQINAIASVLPPEVRKKVGSPLPVVTRKTDKGIEKQLQEKLEKVSAALDFYLQRKLRRKINDVLKKSEAKVSKTGRKESKIGTFGHRIADYAKSVMEMTLEQAEAETQSLNDKFNDIENPELEDYENWDAKTLAVDLLYDFDNATTARLEKAYDFLQLNYKANRKEWLETLQKRKEEKDKWVDEAISFMGAKFKPGDKQKAAKMAKSAKGFWGGFLTQWLSSGHHILSRIVENAKDKQQARLWLYQLLDSRIRSEVDTDAETHDKKEKLYAKLAEILGAEGPTTGHQVRKFLAEALKNKETNITVLSGASKETVKVRLDEVEAILNGEKDAADGRDFTAEDLYALERAYERILDNPEQVPSHVTFERIVSEGRRQLLDETSEGERVGLSYANALQYWLTLRQPDQAEKLAEMGWDEVTKQELDEFLPDEIKEIGVWMSDQLVADGVAINAKHAEEYGVDLAMHDFYWPVRNVVAGKEADISTDGTGPNRGMSSGALKERVRNRAEPAIVNAFSVYFQHTAEMAYWKNNISWFRKFGGAIRTERFATNFKNSVGEKAYRDLNAYLQTIENRGANLRTEMSDMENLIRSMSSRFSLGVLGARISTMWINATSFVNPLASPDVSPVRIIRNAIGMMVDGNGALKATWRNELSVLRRKYGASFEAQLAMKSGNAGPVIIQDAEKLAQLGMLPMNYIDVGMGSVTFAAIYKEYYDAAIKRGDSEQVARSEADQAVTRSQAMLAQPSLGVSRSLQEQKAAGNVFMTLVTMFMSEVRKNAANNYMAWRALLTGKGIVDRPTAARQAFVYSIINTAVVQGFRSIYQFATGSDEEDKELEEQLRDPAFWTYTVLAENARAVPVLSDALLMAVAKPLDQKYWAQRSPFVGITQKLTQAGKIWDDSLTDSERLDSLLDQMQAAGSLFLGGPIIAEAANVGEFVKDIYTNGLGQDLSKKDQIKRLSKEIMANKKDVYEKFEDSEDRIPLMIDVLEQYQTEFPDQFPAILDELKARDSETGEVKTLKSGATEYKLPQEIMKHFVD